MKTCLRRCRAGRARNKQRYKAADDAECSIITHSVLWCDHHRNEWFASFSSHLRAPWSGHKVGLHKDRPTGSTESRHCFERAVGRDFWVILSLCLDVCCISACTRPAAGSSHTLNIVWNQSVQNWMQEDASGVRRKPCKLWWQQQALTAARSHEKEDASLTANEQGVLSLTVASLPMASSAPAKMKSPEELWSFLGSRCILLIVAPQLCQSPAVGPFVTLHKSKPLSGICFVARCGQFIRQGIQLVSWCFWEWLELMTQCGGWQLECDLLPDNQGWDPAR